jgi:hypothetical protein
MLQAKTHPARMTKEEIKTFEKEQEVADVAEISN